MICAGTGVWGGEGEGTCLNCDLGGFGGWAVICAGTGVWGGGDGCLDWHCLNCDFARGREFGVGRGRVSGLALSEL